jgi:flagellar M-ring protein FliF
MGQLQRMLEQIRDQLGGLQLSHRMLLASFVVIMLMTLFVVTQYAGSRQFVELAPGLTTEQQSQAIQYLSINNIEYKQVNGELRVPIERRYGVLGQMQQSGALPDDTTLLFDSVLEKQSWTQTSAQHRQTYLIAKQNELARVIAGMRGLRNATVMIDSPQRVGLGQTVRLPTASATVFTSSGAPLDQQTVDAVAYLIAGSESGLSVEHIRIIDGSTNRQLRARSEDSALAGTYLEQQAKIEKRYRDQLLDLHQYIEGVIIAVSAHVDVRSTTSQTTRVLNPGEGTVIAPSQESSTKRVQRDQSSGGEPGVRSNVGLDIAQGDASGTSFEETISDAQMQTQFGRTVENVVDPRGMPTKINATINVPRSYFVRLYQRQNADAEDPSDDDIKPLVDSETQRIRDGVLPLLESPSDDGVNQSTVVVSMIPDPLPLGTAQASTGSFLQAFGTGGGSTMAISGPIKTLAMGLLAVGALAIMGLTLRKTNKTQHLPTPEELVGVPKTISTDSDIVGEADEAEAALTGIELSEDDLRKSKVQEQVQKVVDEQPQESAMILSDWITQAS